MAVLKILRYPDPILRKKTTEVGFDTLSDPLWLSDVEDCFDTLYRSDSGAAIAANQVGIQKRFFVINKNQGHLLPSDAPLVIVNPRVTSKSSETSVEREGCLSFPGISVSVNRSREIEVEFQYSMDGQAGKLRLTDWIARVFQHEIDHLDGSLFIDHLSTKKKIEIVKKIRKK